MTLPASQPTTKNVWERHAQVHTIAENSEPRKLSDVQKTAIDLYRRGLNVFPLPSAREWRARAEKGNRNKKPPYLLKPLFHARLHLCGPSCKHPLAKYRFVDLFDRTNIGLMMGRTSGNLLAVDCDSHEAFNRIGRELTERNIPFWAISSHRGGAYLLQLKEGEAANQPKDKTPFLDIEIWGNAHYVVIPPSIHPKGTVYEWVTPEPRVSIPDNAPPAGVSVKDLEWLGVRLAREAGKEWQEPELYGLPHWGSQLSWENRKTYAFGAKDGERNTKLTALAYDLAGNEIDRDASYEVLMEAAARCQPPYPKREARAILKSAYAQPRTPAREGNYLRPWQKAKEFAKTFDWKGTFGRKAIKRRAVFMALVKRSRMDNSEVFRASKREVSEMAGMSDKTVWAAFSDLLIAGLVLQAGKSSMGANLYRFGRHSKLTPVVPPCSNSGVSLECGNLYPKTDAEHDMSQLIGIRGFQVWRYLMTEPAKNGAEISRKTGIPQSSVYPALEKLKQYGLIEFNPAEQLLVADPMTQASIEQFNVERGAHGKADARRQLHKTEREIYNNTQMALAISRYRNGPAANRLPTRQALDCSTLPAPTFAN